MADGCLGVRLSGACGEAEPADRYTAYFLRVCCGTPAATADRRHTSRPALPPVFRLYGFDEAAGAADEWTQAPPRWPGTFMSSLFGWDPLAGRCEHTCADVPCASLRDAVTRCAGCIGAGYACRLSTLPNVAFATFKGGWRRGHCANWAGRLGTKSGVEGDCYQSGASGSWANRTEMREVTSEQGLRRKCRELCAACPRCAVVSASFTRRDCSWYATCHRPLQRRSASGRVYSCLRMRHDITAATNPNETAAPPHNSVGRASGIASGSKGCSVSSFPPSVPCSRPHMAAWYLAHEKGCRLWPPGRGADLYQFGVPSSMTTLARLLEAGGRLDEGLFHTYWYICQAAARPSALRSHRARAPCIAAPLRPALVSFISRALDSWPLHAHARLRAPHLLATVVVLLWGRGLDSFVGLPEEDASAMRPASGLWRQGQFSLARAYHAKIKRDADGAEVYDVPDGVVVPEPEQMRDLCAQPHTCGGWR